MSPFIITDNPSELVNATYYDRWSINFSKDIEYSEKIFNTKSLVIKWEFIKAIIQWLNYPTNEETVYLHREICSDKIEEAQLMNIDIKEKNFNILQKIYFIRRQN